MVPRKRTPIPDGFIIPRGMCINDSGYLRYRSPTALRNKYAHRVYCDRLMRESLGRPLGSHEQVHHLCRNPLCWPPTDFHLLILDAALHHGIDSGAYPGRKHRHERRKNNHQFEDFS